MKKILILLAVTVLFTSTSAYAFIGHSKSYKVESDFGVVGPATLVVFPESFTCETENTRFYVPFTSIDYTILENRVVQISVRGKVITVEVNSKTNAKSLYDDLTRAISGDFL